jgi:hypothetical protein
VHAGGWPGGRAGRDGDLVPPGLAVQGASAGSWILAAGTYLLIARLAGWDLGACQRWLATACARPSAPSPAFAADRLALSVIVAASVV